MPYKKLLTKGKRFEVIPVQQLSLSAELGSFVKFSNICLKYQQAIHFKIDNNY